MPTYHQDPVLTCDACGKTTRRPAPCAYEPLWKAGWRWRGADALPLRFVPNHFLVSCPDCEPVIDA
ncbi:hypothetical protein [Streptomyces sp. DH12]|uniref:hypothetical protein n=1 Tax=Streptomyces sp. DH12 TaxID=2857010 RepID=UPI001E474FCD|nr:hypothetical protein [Streptomyces sp. DH12]